MCAELAGVGIRLIEVPRFKAAVERWGDRLLERLFTADEIAYGKRKRNGAENLAARFAAKCAGRDLLAARGGRPPRLIELEVVRRRSGEPSLVVREAQDEGLRFALTLTHDADFAVASVWLEAGIRA